MKIRYTYSLWIEEIKPSGESRVSFTGRGRLIGEGTRVELFSYPIDVHYMAVHGDWVSAVGYLEGEEAKTFYIETSRKKGGDRVNVRLVIKGSVKDRISNGKYMVNLDWSGKHRREIVLLGASKVSFIQPSRGQILPARAGIRVRWIWRRGYRGPLVIRYVK